MMNQIYQVVQQLCQAQVTLYETALVNTFSSVTFNLNLGYTFSIINFTNAIHMMTFFSYVVFKKSTYQVGLTFKLVRPASSLLAILASWLLVLQVSCFQASSLFPWLFSHLCRQLVSWSLAQQLYTYKSMMCVMLFIQIRL